MNSSPVSLLPASRVEDAMRFPIQDKAEPRTKAESFVSDGEVDETIALLGGNEREVVRALLYALDNIASRSPVLGRPADAPRPCNEPSLTLPATALAAQVSPP